MGLFTQFRQRQLDAANAAIARHEAIFACYLERLAANGKSPLAERHVTVLARSPASPAARALVAHGEALQSSGVLAQAIVAHAEPEGALADLNETLRALAPERKMGELLRWADKSCTHEAHEQLTLGIGMCWSGDMLRREPGKRDGLDLFETDSPQTVRLGRLAFQALWSLAAPVPASRLRNGADKQGASYAQVTRDALPKPAFLHPDAPPPLLRH